MQASPRKAFQWDVLESAPERKGEKSPIKTRVSPWGRRDSTSPCKEQRPGWEGSYLVARRGRAVQGREPNRVLGVDVST